MCMWQSAAFAGAFSIGRSVPLEFGTTCRVRAGDALAATEISAVMPAFRNTRLPIGFCGILFPPVKSRNDTQQHRSCVITRLEAREGYTSGIGNFDASQFFSERVQTQLPGSRKQCIRRVALIIAGEREKPVAGQQQNRTRCNPDLRSFCMGGAGRIRCEQPFIAGVYEISASPERRQELIPQNRRCRTAVCRF